jgi:hypothetical protein
MSILLLFLQGTPEYVSDWKVKLSGIYMGVHFPSNMRISGLVDEKEVLKILHSCKCLEGSQ